MYNPQKIEKKWQKIWEKEGIYKQYKSASRRTKKFYVLDMFPYPSGEGLHVGHPRGYIATDILSRFKSMQGYNVFHPMGWDAFGLPAENYAIKNKIHPRIAVQKNIKRFKEQLNMFGFTYDWDKEINTTDSNYYKWTQWIFLQLFKHGLAYESFEPINWCPSCKTGLANEDLEEGLCERCGSQVEKKPLRQWVIKMTAYGDKLLNDLKLLDWPEPIIEQQKNWIGRSEGAVVNFGIYPLSKRGLGGFNSSPCQGEVRRGYGDFNIEIFTTRLDTIFGCTYVVLAPEHKLIQELKSQIKNWKEVEEYINQAKNKTDLARTDLAKEKTGVELKGIKATNPFNKEEVPIFIADYVLASYGTGAIMAVPAHDERDFEFARKYNLPIKQSIKVDLQSKTLGLFINDGILINSGQYTNLNSQKAREEMAKWLIKNKLGEKKVNYKMRDWVFSRQRYWGEPIPLIFCEHCKKLVENSNFKIENYKNWKLIENWKLKIKNLSFTMGEALNPGWIEISEKNLPVKLPDVKSYEPTGTGESPLANIDKWVNTKCPKCGGKAKRETNTMPQWAGSSWYYIAYLIKNGLPPFEKGVRGIISITPFQKGGQGDYIWNKSLIKKWLPVDVYVGGVEHATRHLLYARFWHKFLYDIGAVSQPEPFHKLMNQGLILAEDGRKMSKRWGNVINPDDVIRISGADSLRLYEMFMGPFNQSVAWSTDGLRGTSRFLQRVYNFTQETGVLPPFKKGVGGIINKDLARLIHQTIKKVTEDIEAMRLNTAISSLMILFNKIEENPQIVDKNIIENFLKILSPLAPHLTEEIWRQILGHKNSIHLEKWPKYNPKLIIEEEIKLIIQVNGKVRDIIMSKAGITEKEAKEAVLKSEKIKKFIGSQEIKKVIFIPNKLINIVI